MLLKQGSQPIGDSNRLREPADHRVVIAGWMIATGVMQIIARSDTGHGMFALQHPSLAQQTATRFRYACANRPLPFEAPIRPKGNRNAHKHGGRSAAKISAARYLRQMARLLR